MLVLYAQLKVYVLDNLRLHLVKDHQKIGAKTSLDEIKYTPIPEDSVYKYLDSINVQTIFGIDSAFTPWVSLSTKSEVESIIFENMTSGNNYPKFGGDNYCEVYRFDLKSSGKVSDRSVFKVGIRNIGRCISIFTISKANN